MKKNKTRIRVALLGVTAIAISMSLGTFAACSSDSDTDDDDTKVVTKSDSQEIKNGNFEFYDDNDGLYPISTPDSWDFSYNGTESSAMSGIIKTSKVGWDYLTDTDLPQALEDNDDLDSDDDEKEDYNGALTEDMLFKNSHEATDQDSWSSDDYIDNPYTHNLRWDSDQGKYIYTDGDGKVYTDNDEDSDNYGKVYTDEDMTNEIGTSVLMIHNYRDDDDDYTGNEGYYESSTEITLEANTACKISLWVKTDELYTADRNGNRTAVTCDRGAYIEVATSVGGNSLEDPVTIKNINTEVLNPDNENNGWVQYTIYVEASTFAETTVTLSLGLGKNDDEYTVEGYAFFDDITFERYINIDALKEDTDFNDKIDDSNTSKPLDEDATITFRTDESKRKTTNSEGEVEDYTYPNNKDDKYFYINFATTSSSDNIKLSETNTYANLSVDEDGYTSSTDVLNLYNVSKLDNDHDTAKIPTKLTGNGLDTSKDIVTIETITSDWSFSLTDSTYNTLLTDSLKNVVDLPGIGDETSTLVMLSARGAAYEAQITSDSFTLADGEYRLISFWMKTSDFSGNTAATVTITDEEDDETTSSFTLDSTTVSTVDFEDDEGTHEDIYDGWVRCFIRVDNTSGDNKTFTLKVNLGKTSFKGTVATDYFKNYGWIAMTEFSVMELDEDTYEYTSSLSHCASLSFAEETTSDSEVFDSEQGDKNIIASDLATPSSYTGVNGASVSVKPTGSNKTEYDQPNSNEYAGLLNKENFEEGAYEGNEWYSALASIIDKETLQWNDFAGEYTVQPLLIVNTVRKISESQEGIYNYGYIGSTTTFSSDSYSMVSVRVKASAGAIAYVYLIDTDSATNEVMTYEVPKYNFYYDDDGNILKSEYDDSASKKEKQENTAYTLRSDGLYENGDGKLYANFWNLSKYYDIESEHETFYDENGQVVKFENIVQGETYYADANKTKLAPHYLIGGDDGTKIYKYYDGIDDNEITYSYMEYTTDDDETVLSTDKLVYGVDKSLAHSTPVTSTTPYSFVIDTTTEEGAEKYADKWITVTFYVHTGSESKNYRLELWSGARDKESSYSGKTDSYVLFDYSPENQNTLDESTYSERLSAYENAIKADLIENIKDDATLENSEYSISELEELVDTDYTKIYDYSAIYYTYSLYDSDNFIPFNADTTTDGSTGYSYKYSDYEETLALLRVTDTDNCAMSTFIDYTAVDQDIDIIEPTTDDTDSDGDDDDTSSSSETNVWLLAASIATVAAIVVAMLAMLIRSIIKKHPLRKQMRRNNYNFTKNKRYVRKYVKSNGEVPENETEQPTETTETTVESEATATPEITEGEQQTTETAEETPEEKPEESSKPGEDKKPGDGNNN